MLLSCFDLKMFSESFLQMGGIIKLLNRFPRYLDSCIIFFTILILLEVPDHVVLDKLGYFVMESCATLCNCDRV